MLIRPKIWHAVPLFLKGRLPVSKVSVDILTEFLEVAFHSILYVRDVYPSAVFERHKKYGVPVYICVHHEVKHYIIDLLESIKGLMAKSQVEKISVVILDQSERPIERFVFEVTLMASEKTKDLSYMSRLENTLRAFLLKLNVCNAELNNKPTDCTWTVQVHTKESALLEMQEQQAIHDFQWEEAESHTTELLDPRLVPLKAMDSEVIKMQLFAEESGTKPTPS